MEVAFVASVDERSIAGARCHTLSGDSRVRGTKVLERDLEIAAIGEVLEATLRAEGVVLFVEAPPGIGKTTLLRAAEKQARAAGIEALSALGGELEQDLPFGVVRQLFERRVRAVPPDERERLFAGAARLAEPLVANGVATARESAGDPWHSTLHGLYWLAVNAAAQRPLLISVDDAHWGDASSLRWLAYLCRRLEGLPIAVVATMRPAASAMSMQLLAATASIARVLRPAPLSVTATASLLAEVLGPPADEFVSVCRSVTGGNPLLVRQLADALAAERVSPQASAARRVAELGPVAVSQALALRLASLPPAALPLLRAVAVQGTHVELHQAAAVAQLDTDTAAAAADALASVGVLEPGRPLRVVHPIIHAAVLRNVPPAELERLHVRSARHLTDSGADAAEVAAHLLATEPRSDSWVTDVLRTAARAAVAEGAPETAVACLRRALAEPPPHGRRAELLLELGRAEAAARDPAAIGHLRDALASMADRRSRAAVAVELGRLLMLSARLVEAVAVLDAELTRIGDADRDVAMPLELELLGAARVELSLRPRVADRLNRLREYARRPGQETTGRVVLANLAFEAAMAGAPADDVTDLAERALAGGQLLRQETAVSPAYYLAANALSFADRLDRAHGALDEAIADAQSRGSVLGFAIASCFRAQVNYRLGRLVDAEADAAASLEIARQHGWELGLPISLAFLIEARLDQGDVNGAAQALADARIPGELPNDAHWNLLLFSRAQLHQAQGDVSGGLEDLLECGRRQQLWISPNPAVLQWRAAAALAAARVGDATLGLQLADEDLELSRAFGAPRSLGIALRTAGLLRPREQGLELLREAVDVLERSRARLDYAKALTDLGAAMRRAGRREMARGPLRQALDLAQRCGARQLEQRALDELHAAGARPRTRTLTGVDSLTASERRTADMAAAGLTNREIAQALFVTVKTVEGHLHAAFMKLDVRARGELRAALASSTGAVG